MHRGLIAAAMTVSAWALPAQAADVATLSCIADEAPESARTALIESARKVALQQEPGDQGEAQGALAEAMVVCIGRHHWSDETATAAVYYTVFDLVVRGALIAGAPQGITEANVQAAIDAMPESAREQLATSAGGVAEFQAAWAAAGFKLRSANQDELLGNIAMAMAARAKYRAQFIAS